MFVILYTYLFDGVIISTDLCWTDPVIMTGFTRYLDPAFHDEGFRDTECSNAQLLCLLDSLTHIGTLLSVLCNCVYFS